MRASDTGNLQISRTRGRKDLAGTKDMDATDMPTNH